PQIDVGREGIEVARADPAVEPVGGDDQVSVEFARRRDVVDHLGLEPKLDAEGLATLLQNVEQALATEAAKGVAARGDCGPPEMDVDVVPVVERTRDFARGRRIGRLEVAHRVVGKHDPPAEGVVWAIALDDADRVRRIALLEKKREIEPRGAPADAKYTR